MKYTLEFKLECVEKYKKGIRIDLPPGAKHRATFSHCLMGWVKAYEDLGAEGLMRKSGNREWAPEERLALAAKVIAGSPMREAARSGHIPYGMLYQWVRRHREMGHGRLAVQLPVREGVPIPRAGHVRGRHRRLGPLLIAQFRADGEDSRRGVREEPEPGGPGLPRRPGPAIPDEAMWRKARGKGDRPADVPKGQLHRQLHNGIVLRRREARVALRTRGRIRDLRATEGRHRGTHRLLQQQEDQGQNKMDAPGEIPGGIHEGLMI